MPILSPPSTVARTWSQAAKKSKQWYQGADEWVTLKGEEKKAKDEKGRTWRREGREGESYGRGKCSNHSARVSLNSSPKSTNDVWKGAEEQEPLSLPSRDHKGEEEEGPLTSGRPPQVPSHHAAKSAGPERQLIKSCAWKNQQSNLKDKCHLCSWQKNMSCCIATN